MFHHSRTIFSGVIGRKYCPSGPKILVTRISDSGIKISVRATRAVTASGDPDWRAFGGGGNFGNFPSTR
jgi:hypothetical protein